MPQRPVDAAEFGARGDGVANDTEALQAAIDYCRAAGRRRLTLGRGREYVIDRPLRIRFSEGHVFNLQFVRCSLNLGFPIRRRGTDPRVAYVAPVCPAKAEWRKLVPPHADSASAWAWVPSGWERGFGEAEGGPTAPGESGLPSRGRSGGSREARRNSAGA